MKYDQLIEQRETLCEVTFDADRIKLEFERIYPTPLKHVAEEMENMMLCKCTIVEKNTMWLMQPDYGMFADDDEFCAIVQELFEEENYNIIYKE